MALPTPDTSLTPHLWEIIGIVGPFITVILALVAWAWRSMEKNIDRLETAIREHATHDIQVHDAIFKQIRDGVVNHDTLKEAVNKGKIRLAKLEGEHDVYHNGNPPGHHSGEEDE